jgi:hypothetical protein
MHIGEKINCGACDMYMRQNRCIQGFGGGELMETDHLEDTDRGIRII